VAINAMAQNVHVNQVGLVLIEVIEEATEVETEAHQPVERKKEALEKAVSNPRLTYN
jgi:hypothetical protein